MGKLIKIGIIGDFEEHRLSHQATNEALNHCARHLSLNVEINWLPTESLVKNANKNMKGFDGFWCAPGEYKNPIGAICAIRYIREHNFPFIGTCGGFQYTVIEYVQNYLGLADVQHEEYNPGAENLIITALSCSLVGETRKVYIDESSRIYQYYQTKETEERFSCKFGINGKYRNAIEESGFKAVGTDENGEVRILDLIRNDFFMATLFQPQLSSTPEKPHRLITAFLSHALKQHLS